MRYVFIWSVFLFSPLTAYAQPLVNGDFETGDLTGWTTFTDPNGTLGVGLPDVVPFDTNNDSSTSLGVELRVGGISDNQCCGGGGIFQNVQLEDGAVDITVDVAALGGPAQNGEGGIFSLLFDGVEVDLEMLGTINGSQTLHGTLQATIPSVSPGSHEVRIAVRRPFTSVVDVTPIQYIDNVVVVPFRRPVAADDSHQVEFGQTLSVPAAGVLANDSDPDNDPVTATLVSGPTRASSFTLNADGSFDYTPAPGFTSGTDTFTYMAEDARLQSNVATVTITVVTVPVATDDTFQIPSDLTLVRSAPGILANDSDPGGDLLNAVLVAPPASAASFSLNPDGSFSYTPSAGFTGSDSFTYFASDGSNQSAPATVTISVTPSCIDLLRAPADAYEALVQTTLAQQIPAIESLLQSGNSIGAAALQQSTIAMLVQEASNAASATQTECASCIAQLESGGNGDLVPAVNTACVAQIHRIGSIQSRGISQLENVITPANPSRSALLLRDGYLREIDANAGHAAATFHRFSDRYGTIVRRHSENGDAAAADAAVASARSVLQRSSAARVQRIQELCDNFVARLSSRPGAHQLIAAVTAAATSAMAEVQLAEAEAMREIETARAA